MRAVARDTKAKLPPLCRYCGCAIKKRTDWLRIFTEPQRTEVPEMRNGDRSKGEDLFKQYPTGRMTKLHPPKHVVADPLPQTKAEAQKLTNLKVISVRRCSEGIDMVGVWDGESYVDEFFCNGKHALNYAYGMVQSQHNTLSFPAYREAVAKQKAKIT